MLPFYKLMSEMESERGVLEAEGKVGKKRRN